VTLQRISRLQETIKAGQQIYVTNLTNIRYLTGFTGSNAALLVTKSSAILATDSRYEIQALQQVPDLEHVIGRNLPELLLKDVKGFDILVEGANLSVNAFQSLCESTGNNFITTTGLVESLRIIKDESEVHMIRTAADIATNAFLDVIETIKVGQTEREIRNTLERRMRDLGADDIAFASIVAAGPNSAIPHHEPTDRELAHGDLLKIDFGAKLNGYHSDCTRTLILGKPADWQLDLHQSVSSAQESGRNAIRAGIRFTEVEDSVRRSLSESGFENYFTHGLGHGVGLEIHEDPFFGRNGDAKIAPNTVVTIEPGAYLKSKGGVRVEDTIVVDSQGHQNLTNLPYELIEL
jgi:Xaa-Pro dipeptidase